MHILHLEDDGPLREILGVAIKAVQPKVTLYQFMNSADAIRHIVQYTNAIDLFILDIRVPGPVDGLEVARRIRQLECQGVIVITSAYTSPDRAFLTEVNCEWIPKPWHIYQTTERVLQLAQTNA